MKWWRMSRLTWNGGGHGGGHGGGQCCRHVDGHGGSYNHHQHAIGAIDFEAFVPFLKVKVCPCIGSASD